MKIAAIVMTAMTLISFASTASAQEYKTITVVPQTPAKERKFSGEHYDTVDQVRVDKLDPKTFGDALTHGRCVSDLCKQEVNIVYATDSSCQAAYTRVGNAISQATFRIKDMPYSVAAPIRGQIFSETYGIRETIRESAGDTAQCNRLMNKALYIINTLVNNSKG